MKLLKNAVVEIAEPAFSQQAQMRGDPKQTRPSERQLDCETAHPNGRQSAF